MASSEHPADILPDDLDPSYGADIYQIPNNDKRKLAGYLYLLTGTILIFLFLVFDNSALVIVLRFGKPFGFPSIRFIFNKLS